VNAARVCTLVFGSMPFTAVWEISVLAAVDGQPPAALVAAGGVPQVIAGVLILASILDPANRSDSRESSGPAVYEYLPPTQARRAVQPGGRKELAR
jgi:hypothetical protein